MPLARGHPLPARGHWRTGLRPARRGKPDSAPSQHPAKAVERRSYMGTDSQMQEAKGKSLPNTCSLYRQTLGSFNLEMQK